MIEVGNSIEIKGEITATSTTGFTVTMSEAYIDSQWRAFTGTKTIDIATSDYGTSLTPQELALCKLLAEANKTSSTLTLDQQVIAQSIIAKLPTV
jgi:hypothetical protein